MTQQPPSADEFCPAFREVHDPAWLYPASGHRHARAVLEDGVEGNHAVTLLTGLEGAGKTLLLRAIVAEYRDGYRIGWIGQSGTDMNNPLRSILLDFAVPVQDETPAAMLAALRGMLLSGKDRRPAFLIVDNGHRLSDAGLAQLVEVSDLESGGRRLMPILLAGEPPLRDRIGRPANHELQSRIHQSYILPPMSAPETAAYIEHRFEYADCDCHLGDSPFDAGSLQVLHYWSGGVPGLLNDLVQHCLHEAKLEVQHHIGAAFADICLRDVIAERRPARPMLLEAQAQVIEQPALPKFDPERLLPVPVPMPVEAKTSRPPILTAISALVFGAVALGAIWSFFPQGQTPSDPVEMTGAEPAIMDGEGAEAVESGAGGSAAVPLANLPGPEEGGDTSASSADAAATRAEAGAAASDVPALVSLEPVSDPAALLDEALQRTIDAPAEAALLMQRAALMGHARAAYFLGQIYELGDGVAADLARARAWYLAAEGVRGAQRRLDALAEPATPVAPLSPPVILMQGAYPDGSLELHWRSADGESPARFAVEFVRAGEGDRVERVETDLSAALLDGPVERWRVIALDADGGDAAATDWISPDAAAR